jgi:type IV secretory pathway VirD2 relaxase
MASSDDGDLFEGDVSRRRARSASDNASLFRPPSATSSKRVAARQRMAWFNRSRGAPAVKLAPPPRPAGQQRVIIKLKPVTHAGGGGGGLMRHALYVERDGAGRDGDPVKVFDRDHDQADGAGFVERCDGDRHHFRVIISPENGAAMDDLKDYTRDLMGQVERDLGTRIDWIAAEHHDTGRPHVHLLMRGKDQEGRDLVIPRPYVSHGFRHAAEGLATEILGPRREPDRDERAARLERVTHLDRDLIDRARGGELAIGDLPEAHRSALVQRLNKLEGWGLAEQPSPGLWRLDANLEDKLTRLGDAAARERAEERLLAQEGRGLEPERMRALEDAHSSHRVVGRLVGFEPLSDKPAGPQLAGVEAIDGWFWTARVARLEDLRGLAGVQRGAIVELERAKPEIRPSDRTISEIARDNGGDYSKEIHRETRPTDSERYIEAHVRRLEALRRDGIIERERDGTFRIPADYSARVAAREGLGGRESARVSLIDPHPLDVQAGYDGPTWLDRIASGAEDRSQLRYEGFGEEARTAWLQREATLKTLGLGDERDGGFYIGRDFHERLAAREEHSLRERVESQSGRIAHIARDGEHVAGVYVNRIHGAEQSYAVIEHGRTATLAPWRPEMDRAMGQAVSGHVSNQRFEYKVGKEAEKAIKVMRGLGVDR